MACVDIVAIKQPFGGVKLSPFVVRFRNEATVTAPVKMFLNGTFIESQCGYEFVVQKGHHYAHFHRTGTDLPVIGSPLPENNVNSSVFETPVLDGTDPSLTWRDKLLNSVNNESFSYEWMTPPAEWCEKLNIHADSKLTFMFENEIVHCAIFVWNHDDKIVISDIDGTITQSDVPGMLSSFFGFDYSHKGVASLFNTLHTRNYKVVYMTARSITMIELTRGYLKKVSQKTGDETHILPPGPVITTPNTILNALYREVVVRRPETFKITILKCIQNLFPEKDPFIYGFGNRPTDDVSYQAVGIRPSRIFRIDSSSRVLIPSLNRHFEGYSEVEKQIHNL